MKIYIDNEFKCHLINDGTMIEVETNFFDKLLDFLEDIYTDKSVRFMVAEIVRGDRKIDCRSNAYALKVWIWRILRPARRYLLAIYRRTH